ncbi:MAG: tetratricopeptide repeat protein [Armatimonadota bacterium]
MTKEYALLLSLAGIAGAAALGIGFSTGFFHPEPLSPDGTVKRDPGSIVASATPKDAPSLVARAQEYMALGEYSKAIVFLQATTRLTPSDYTAHKLLAVAAFEEKDMVLAANACEAAMRLEPKDIDARLGLAKALFALNRLPDAAAVCRAILALPSGSAAQREAAQMILERIPPAAQNREPEVTFPIIAAG